MKAKKDCFAYNERTHRCNILLETYCLRGECGFYKTKENYCDKCKKSWGRLISCAECKEMRK